ILGGAKPDEQRALREYGWHLGLAFQLVDDALDYSGTSGELGKQPLADLSEGKLTLPLLLTLLACSERERGELIADVEALALGASQARAPEAGRLARVSQAVERHGGAVRTLARASTLVETAIAHLEPFEDGAPRRALVLLARFVVARRS